jgi:hypothetical protein
METIPCVSLAVCEYNKTNGSLVLSNGYIGMPSKFQVKSHKTGKVVTFIPVTHGDRLFDEDQWDGEQQVYRPIEHIDSVEYCIITRNY